MCFLSLPWQWWLSSSPLFQAQRIRRQLGVWETREGMVGEQTPSSLTEGDTCRGNSAWHHLGPL